MSGAGRLCGQWDGSRGCREEAEVQKEEERHYQASGEYFGDTA